MNINLRIIFEIYWIFGLLDSRWIFKIKKMNLVNFKFIFISS